VRNAERLRPVGGRFRGGWIEPETPASEHTLDAAYLAAGAAAGAVDAVAAGAAAAFALVRPPGHHAEPEQAMGFCLFNNVAIAAAHAIESRGMERVLIVDWDIHHGNGTQAIFYHRRDVLVFDVHQDGLFPAGTGGLEEQGEGDGRGFNVNCPLPPGMNDGDYALLFDAVLVPLAESFAPQLVLVSAGFDAHRDDPLGGMQLTERGFARLCGIVRGIASRHAGGRLALILEGGYDLGALSRSVHACLEVLAGTAAPVDPAPPSDGGRRAIDRIVGGHRGVRAGAGGPAL
jgi:acetoin utilization deacetylase AcuC-like enzyme